MTSRERIEATLTRGAEEAREGFELFGAVTTELAGIEAEMNEIQADMARHDEIDAELQGVTNAA